MRKIHILILMTAALMLSLPVSAATVLQYSCDFAIDGSPGVAGEPINAGPGAAPGIPDESGNGYDMWGWVNAEGTDINSPYWSTDTPSGSGLSLDLNFNGDNGLDGYLPGGTAINEWQPSVWTIECKVNLDNTGGWYTFIGRDQNSAVDVGSNFYFQKNDVNDQFRINIVTTGGARYELDSGIVPTPGEWYGVAAISDGTTLYIYVKEPTDTVYELGNSVAMNADPAQNRLAISLDGGGAAGVWTFGRGYYSGGAVDNVPGLIDDIRFSDTALPADQLGKLISNGAYDPDPQPYNEGDGTVGTIVGGNAEVYLNFKAGADPNAAQTGNEVNPAILEHHVYWHPTDPNLPVATSYDGSIAQTSLSDPNVTYGPVYMPAGSNIYWKVEEGLDDGTGTAYGPGDPNNIPGQLWTFFTVSLKPTFTKQPRPAVADPDATFTVTGSTTAQTYQWFKVVGDPDWIDPYTDPDTQLTDNATYSGTTTNTMTVSNATLAEEGQYYCICYNGLTASDPSNAVWLVLPRLVGHWKLDGNMTDSVTDDVPGAVTHDGFMAYGDPNYVSDPDVDGFAGNGMRFFNNGEFMELPGANFFNFYADGFTFIYWYKQYSDVGWRLPMSKFDIGQRGWLFGHSGTNPNTNFIIENGGANAYTGTMTDGQWNMAAVTYDADTDELRAFSNGDENDQDTVDLSALPLPVRPVQIGGDDAGGTPNSLDCAISEVRMYSYPLTPTEIATMYTDIVADVFVCVNEDETFEAMDLNGDCRINLGDFSLVASEWLECLRIPTDTCLW